MTLATCKDNIPWASTVLFAYDNDLNFYFLTKPSTRKAEYLLSNQKVAAAINEYVNKIGYIVGIQLEGTAEMIDKSKNTKEWQIFRSRFDWAHDYWHESGLFKITPQKIVYLDDEKFGRTGREELEL